MKKSLLLIIAWFSVGVSLAQQELLYGVYTGTESLKSSGTQKAETYDVAMYLQDESLVGMKVVGINVPIKTGAVASDYKAWLTTELKVEGGKSVADIATVDFTPDGKWAEVTFEEPYTLTAEGIYAGYSFTIGSVGTSDGDASKTPIVCIASDEVDRFFVHTSRTFRKWNNMAETTLGSVGAPAMVVRLGGEGVKEHAALFEAPDEVSTYVMTDQEATLSLPLVNHGTADITGIDYDLQVGTETFVRTAKVSLKGTYYGRRTSLNVEMPAMSTSGTRNVTIKVTKINGADNEEANPQTEFTMAYLSELPKHKPLMEEYTGTWCQYCPSGMAAMEAMNKIYGDDFVGVAYHSGDAMQVTSRFPNDIQTYPNSYLDRVLNVSPFFGSSGSSLGIQDDWKRRSNIIAPATLGLKAQWNAEETAVSVTATVTFVRGFQSSPYQLSYILTADGLTGEGKQWSQVNAYSGSSEFANDPYLGAYTRMPGNISGLHFNDVAIQLSNTASAAMEGSLPIEIVESTPYSHTYTFDTSTNELVQDKNKLRAVAVLINTQTGEVVNAEKVKVESAATGIKTLSENNNEGNASRFDLQGRPVGEGTSHSRGLTIIRMGNGQAIKVLK